MNLESVGFRSSGISCGISRGRPWRRFNSPTQMMCYLGLVSSEHSSGSKERKGRITKAGDPTIESVQPVLPFPGVRDNGRRLSPLTLNQIFRKLYILVALPAN